MNPTTATLRSRWEGAWTAAERQEQDLDVNITFTSPSGRRRVRGAFWDGGAVWRARFQPDEPGEWRYEVHAEGTAPGIHGEGGSFCCEPGADDDPEAPAARFRTHGSLQVAAGGRYLEHADGTPFFWLGDTVWNGPLLARTDEWSAYLADRTRKGFTALQYVLAAPWRTAYADGQGQIAYSGRDPIQLHPEFFRRMDRRVDASADAGFLSVIVLLWAIRGEENPGYSLPEDQAARLARYIVARYGAHPVAWILAGDGSYTGDALDRWRRIGRTVFPDADRAPVTMHAQGTQWPFEEFRSEPWFDYIGYQSGHGDDDRTLAWIHSGPPAQDWNHWPVRPVLNLEPPYEEHRAYHSRLPHSAYNVRRACYWSMLASPAAGLTYGGHGLWSWQIEAGLPLNHLSTGAARRWHDAIHLPGSTHVGHLASLFGSLPWWTLEPDPGLLRVQPGADAPARFVGSARSRDGKCAVLYLPVGGSVELHGERLAVGGHTEWFNPRTAARIPISARPAANSYAAPDDEDWVLVHRP